MIALLGWVALGDGPVSADEVPDNGGIYDNFRCSWGLDETNTVLADGSSHNFAFVYFCYGAPDYMALFPADYSGVINSYSSSSFFDTLINVPGASSFCTAPSTYNARQQVWMASTTPQTVNGRFMPVGSFIVRQLCGTLADPNGDHKPPQVESRNWAPWGTTGLPNLRRDTPSPAKFGTLTQWLGVIGFASGSGLTAPWPDDWYPGGAPGPGAGSPFCGMEVTAESESMDLVRPGDDVEFTVDLTPGYATSLELQWFPGGPWLQLWSAANIGDPYVRTMTAPSAFAAGSTTARPTNSIKLRCTEAAGPVRTAEIGDDFEQPDVPLRPCQQARLAWPVNHDVFVGDVEPFAFSYSGVPQPGLAYTTIDVEIASFDEAEARPANSLLSWSTAVDDAALGAHSTINRTALYDGSVRQFTWRCKDALGTYYGDPWAAATSLFDPEPSPDETTEEDCLAQSGIGFSPSSWVPGALSMGSCLVKVLTIPGDDFMADQFGTTADPAEGFDDDSVFYPLTLLSTTLQAGADLVIVSDAEINAGNCAFSLPWSGISADGSGPSGGSTTVLGLEGDDISFNTCSDAGMRTAVKAARTIGLVGSVLGFILWAYRWASQLSMGNAAT